MLRETPEPFAAASREKQAALSHFQPDGVLATRPPALRAERRRYNEAVLGNECPRHALAARFDAPREVIEADIGEMLRDLAEKGVVAAA